MSSEFKLVLLTSYGSKCEPTIINPGSRPHGSWSGLRQPLRPVVGRLLPSWHPARVELLKWFPRPPLLRRRAQAEVLNGEEQPVQGISPESSSQLFFLPFCDQPDQRGQPWDITPVQVGYTSLGRSAGHDVQHGKC